MAKWVATNLKPARGGSAGTGEFSWGFDLPSIADMYESYELKSHWPLLEKPPQGLQVWLRGACLRQLEGVANCCAYAAERRM